MPRVTYGDRFEALLAKDLTSRDRSFVKSLYEGYKRQRSLTTRQRPWLSRLEEKYSPAALAAAEAAKGSPEGQELQTLVAAIEVAGGDAWSIGFVRDMARLHAQGRTLSDRQRQILDEKRKQYGPEAIRACKEWEKRWVDSPELAERWNVVLDYYKALNERERTSYYSKFILGRAANPDLIPHEKAYNKVMENKYAKKIVDGWFDDPLYQRGDFVSIRQARSVPRSVREACEKGAVVIKVNAGIPVTACRGNKLYRLLPVAAVTPLIVEERHIKKLKRAKKK
jgi:hypothetical protein